MASGEFLVLTVPFCSPWDSAEAVYTAESADTTIATASTNGQQLRITGLSPGETLVFVYAELEGNPNQGWFTYEVTVFTRRDSRASP